MQQAVEQAGLENVKLMSGPEAAAMWNRYMALSAALWERANHPMERIPFVKTKGPRR